MADEKAKTSEIPDNNYKPSYYKLSILNDSSQTVLSLSTLLIDYNDDVQKKIEELKTFLVSLWHSNLLDGTSNIKEDSFIEEKRK